MSEWGGLPEPEAIGEALDWLDQRGFDQTSRQPLFAARHWSPALERRALRRFSQGLCNVEEVAVPRWYQARLNPETKKLFEVLTLGQGSGTWPALGGLTNPDGHARWRLVSRFSRYLLHSRPEVEGDSTIYFGDDTLFLMQGARRLLSGLEGQPQVVDLCCGGGGVGLGLPSFRGELVGVDVNPTAIAMAQIMARAQKLANYSYVCDDAKAALIPGLDLVVGNPPTLPPDLGGQNTLYASGTSDQLMEWLHRILDALKPTGRALLTVFSTARGRGRHAPDALRTKLEADITPRRGYSYTVRRQFPLPGELWLRHVALEFVPEGWPRVETFLDPASSGIQLPALGWRRRSP